MKMKKMIVVIPMCCMLMTSPLSVIRAEAVTVDINDNYDAGLLQEEPSGGSGNNDEGSAEASTTAATTTTPSAATTASSETTVTPVSTTPATTTTTDLPKTGDDDRIILTFVAMLASFSVFLTALVWGGHFEKNGRKKSH